MLMKTEKCRDELTLMAAAKILHLQSYTSIKIKKLLCSRSQELYSGNTLQISGGHFEKFLKTKSFCLRLVDNNCLDLGISHLFL